jgi:hypothetical protein
MGVEIYPGYLLACAPHSGRGRNSMSVVDGRTHVPPPVVGVALVFQSFNVRLDMARIMILILGALVTGSAFAAETDTVIEGFVCNLNAGKTMADFDKATAFWNSQMDKIPGGDAYFAVVMTPLRANPPGDLIWLGSYGNLNDWAKNEAAYEASAEGQAAEAGFDKVAKCRSGLWFSQALHEGLPPATVGGDPGVIETYQCTLRKGKTMPNVEHANATWKAYIDAAKQTDATLAKFSAYVMVPWLADVPFDLAYLVVNDNLADFGKLNTAALTSSAGGAVGAAFDDAMTCQAGLMSGKVVRVPARQNAQ